VKPKMPLIPGPEGVGRVVEVGLGKRVFRSVTASLLPWLGYACGRCRHCIADWETYCHSPQYMGYTMDAAVAAARRRDRPPRARLHRRHLGGPMTVLVEQYWREISTRLAHHTIPVRHFVLHADQDTLRGPIERATPIPSPTGWQVQCAGPGHAGLMSHDIPD
jgi:hypothetical protein